MLTRAAIFGSVIFCLAGHYPAGASVFPNEIQNCIFNAVCSTPELIQQASTFSAYSYTDGGTAKFLFAYGLGTSSNESTDFTATRLSGVAWVSANAIYDLTQERHFFTLYLDSVTPPPTNLWIFDSDGLDVGISMPTADLLAGGSFFRLWEDQGAGGLFLEGELGTHGDLGQPIPGVNHSFVQCLADTCEVGAEFNLLNMQYLQFESTAQLILDPADQRSLLYTQYQDWDSDDAWYRSQSYEVIPIPAAVWLFGSGLISLYATSRKASIGPISSTTQPGLCAQNQEAGLMTKR